MSKQAEIKLGDIPNGWSEEAADFFNKLLIRKPEYRLGYRGYKEIKEHIWIKYFNWNKLFEKKIMAPFIPYKKENFDRKYCRITDNIGEETKIRYEKYKNAKNFNNLFSNFTFCRIISEEDNAKKKLYNNYRSQFKQKRKEIKFRNNSTSNLIKDNLKYFKKLNSHDYDSLNQSGSYSYRNNFNSKLNSTNFKKYSSSVNNINPKKLMSLKASLNRKKNILIDNSISNRSNNSIYNTLKKNDYKQMIKSMTSKNFIDYYKKKSENIGNIYRQKLIHRIKKDKTIINDSNSFYNLMPSLNNSLIAYNNQNKKNISKSLLNFHNNNLNKRHRIRATLYKNRNNENLSKSSRSILAYKNKSSYSQKIKEKRNLYFNNIKNNLSNIITKKRDKIKNENSILSNNISSSSNIIRQMNITNKHKNMQNPQNINYYRNRLNKKNNIIKNKIYFEVELNEQYDQYKKKERNNKKNKDKQIYSKIENSIELNGVNNENRIHINFVINDNNSTAKIIEHNFNSNLLNGKKKKKGLKRSYS